MVKVCDAIMGSGKTSATISYINAHPEKRFIYITPYLPEAARIKEGCPDADFVEPSDKIPQFGFSKSNHTLALIGQGRNIASTHSALAYYTDETIASLKEQDYTVIIDEALTIFQNDDSVSAADIQVATEAGYITEVSPGEYAITEKAKDYRGGKFSHIFRIMMSRNLMCLKSGRGISVCYWVFTKKLFETLDDVFVLTYLFDRSEMQMFFHINGIEYSNIGISRTHDGGYVFADHPDYVPEYVSHLDELISIESSERMNEIGWDKNALSMSWYKSDRDGSLDQLRKNLYNYFRARAKSDSVSERMCGTYKKYWGVIRSKGYWNSNVPFSQKSSNEFRERTVLAYPVNLFANGDIVRFYFDHGEKFDQDHYALSIMLQWIWRSAIRDGKPIRIYVPSRRMRMLLIGWIENVSRSAAA